MMTEEEAFQLLGERLHRLFDPLSWKIADVLQAHESHELGNGEESRGPQTGSRSCDACAYLWLKPRCPLSQFQAFRTVVLNEFGRNGLEGELERLEYQKGLRNGTEWAGIHDVRKAVAHACPQIQPTQITVRFDLN